jgi:lipopolysaccharide/colanic/teichoic acid biosynthesis glycosyltransferase
VFDIILSFFGLILASPILAVCTILLSVANEGAGVFFLQERPGKNAKIFKVIKFKTMTDSRDQLGNLLPDQCRITKVGSVIRKTSIDELPQLINVLKGDMSLIGPRPLMPEYLPKYSHHQARRHEVRPGITGWAQVNGRNFLPFSKRFEMDIWYVDNLSFLLDLRIFLMSIVNVIRRRNISIGDNIAKNEDDLGFTK